MIYNIKILTIRYKTKRKYYYFEVFATTEFIIDSIDSTSVSRKLYRLNLE